MNEDNAVAVMAASLLAWPLIVGGAAAALGLRQGQRRAIVFCVIAGACALGTGLLLDVQSVAAGDASSVGSFITSLTVAFTPPAVAAALTPRSAADARAGFGRRAFAAYGALCVRTPAAVALAFVAGAFTCRGSCL